MAIKPSASLAELEFEESGSSCSADSEDSGTYYTADESEKSEYWTAQGSVDGLEDAAGISSNPPFPLCDLKSDRYSTHYWTELWVLQTMAQFSSKTEGPKNILPKLRMTSAELDSDQSENNWYQQQALHLQLAQELELELKDVATNELKGKLDYQSQKMEELEVTIKSERSRRRFLEAWIIKAVHGTADAGGHVLTNGGRSAPDVSDRKISKPVGASQLVDKESDFSMLLERTQILERRNNKVELKLRTCVNDFGLAAAKASSLENENAALKDELNKNPVGEKLEGKKKSEEPPSKNRKEKKRGYWRRMFCI